MKKKIIVGCIFIGMVGLLTLFGPKIIKGDYIIEFLNTETSSSIIKQKIIGIKAIPEYVYNVYYQENEVGVLSSMDGIDPLLKKVYDEKYTKDFPNSALSLIDDVHISKELSFLAYENIDNSILNYMYDNDYFAVEVNKISLSNGAVFYVKNLEDFTTAKDIYVLNFVSEEGLNNIQSKIITPNLSTYTSKETSISIQESIEVSTGYASIDNILMNVNDIIYYLSYGDNTIPEYYTVQKYDTVEGIASEYGLEATHIIMINPEIKRTDQILTPGMQVNVTYYNSPLTILVTRERLYAEKVYPAATKFIYDSTLAEGRNTIIQAEKVGSADILMQETYVNGVLMTDLSNKISSTIKISPQQEIKKMGTKVIPGTGTGTFRWPLDNPTVTCRWFCNSSHTAIDVQNRYNRYGNIYAADRGTVVTNSYHYINGYYMRINHGNGFLTYYGHMRYKSPIPVGTKVEKGAVIGTIGMTGYASGPHIHFAIEKNGVRLNPCIYLGC